MTGIQSASPATTQDSAAPMFSAQLWAAFWAAPDLSRGMNILADDIVGYWPGDPEPVQGVQAYTRKIAELLAAAPDLRLELVDSATVPGAAEGEQLVFLHYVGRGTGPDGPFEIRGLDRVRTRNGMVVENVIRYEPVLVTRR
ncbi:nuclear transport factor 2 family protein [Mycobacterium sp.]|uniref:nuclear transport factor 2 family protein n=2 Tax=Mycobacterium sp. TaxID=1785 RepID=UPI003F9901D3